MEAVQDIYEVIGGAANGGILVRAGKELESDKEEARLSTGTRVRALEVDEEAGRIRYEIVSGDGPKTGWVSLSVQGKELLIKDNEEDVSTEDASTQDSEGDDAIIPETTRKGEEQEAQDALRSYCQRMQESRELETEVHGGGFARKAFPWNGTGAQAACHPAQGQLRVELEKQMGLEAGALATEGAATQDHQERRVDPMDDFPRTLEELRIRYAGQYSGAEIRDYWYTWCRPLEEVEAEQEEQMWELKPTFGYAANLEEKPSFARYDIREEVCLYVGGFRHGQVVRDACDRQFTVIGVKPDVQSGELRLWLQPNDIKRPAAGAFPHANAAVLRAKLARAPARGERLHEITADLFASAEDSDLEDMLLCRKCHLPVGEVAYDKDGPVHGECMAQLVLQELKEEGEAHVAVEALAKKERRIQYNIGWKIESVPRNLGGLGKLGLQDMLKGSVALALDAATNSIHLVPTTEPSAAINLEYLSIALKVRVLEGREPMFSLDAVDATRRDSMQRKVFEPEWLAGTSVGEVMFQADYHLKELSMGEYEQPVVGMRSCRDISEEANQHDWSAREWFVVRKAEIHVNEEGVLSPFVKMGVEAREQVLKGDKLVDTPFTRHDHPLVKYAEAFTHNFDLIAERKSVIYHLRELAKASVMAKYLVDADVTLDSMFYNLADFPTDSGILEIPQLWNERYRSKIQVKDGAIVETPQDSITTAHNVYGGIDFGLDRFSVAAPRAAISRVSARVPQRTALLPGAPTGAFQAPARSMLASAPALSSVSRPAGGVRAVTGPASVLSAAQPRMGFAGASRLTAPQGVDLNLDRFDLSAATHVSPQASAGGWGVANLEAISSAFWANLDGDAKKSVFPEEDRNLLKAIFNPKLSDRREDGDCFIPPDTSASHVAKLHDLVKEEAVMRQRRQDHFLSKGFVMDDAGPIFPASWTSSVEIAHGQTSRKSLAGAVAAAKLDVRPDFAAEASLLEKVLPTATPIFDMSTEDDIRYCIYRFGSFEVRTTSQGRDSKEVVGSVFTIREGPSAKPMFGGIRYQRVVDENSKVIKATEFVEHSHDTAKKGCASALCRRSYIVLETEKGGVVITELLADGTVTWQENPSDIEDRNSLAKVVRTVECVDAGVTIGDMRRMQIKETQKPHNGRATASQRKAYAQYAYSQAQGEVDVYSGFHPASNDSKWQLYAAGEARTTSRKAKEQGSAHATVRKAKGKGRGKSLAGKATPKVATEEEPTC